VEVIYLKLGNIIEKLESELQQQGELGGAREAYQQAERTINDMKKRISQSLGKPSDIYTEMRRYISPDIMQQLGLYLTPEQLLTKSKGALGGEEKLDVIFKKTIVGDILEGGKLTAPIEKVREALKGISDLDEEMVKTLTDADKFKRAGSEIQEAWNFEKLTDRVTKLRASLETFLRFRLQEEADVVGRKNLEDTLKLLKNLENQYSAFGRIQRQGPAGWGEMGITKVPRFIEPQQQFAMHARNIQKVREYFRKTEEEGGPKAGERYTYMFKVIGEAGDTIKNVAYDFRKYGDALNFAGERVGVFREAQRDLFKFMQEGGQTFKSAIMRAVRWGAASRLVYGGWQKLGQSIGLLADIETGMANLRMIMSPLETDFSAMGKSAIGFAKQYGVPMTDVLKSMKIFAQQGLQQGEVIDRTQTATLASNVTTLSAAEATEALTAAMKVFRQEGESAMKFMDAWSEVEAKHAITAGDMANALKKAASAGKNAGFTFDELNGVVAAIGSVTRQSGKEVGTAMRFIFRRLTSEKGPKELAKIGIPVLTETGELRKGFDVLNDLSLVWKDLTSAQRMNIAQSIGGTRQYNALLVLMDNWNEALSAIKDSTNSKGSAERRNLEIMKTFTKQMEQMKSAATEVYMSFGKITFPIAKTGLKGLKFLLEAFTEVPGVVKGAMVAIAGFFIYMSKGADIIDYFFERWRGGKSIIGEVMKGMGKEWTMGMSELFGTGALEQNLKTIGKTKRIKIPMGVFDVSPEGIAQERIVEKLIPQGKKLKDFHSVLGKTVFLLKQAGMTYNEFIGDMVKGGGDLVKDVGGPFDYIAKKMYALENMFKKITSTIVTPEMVIGALETGGFIDLIPAIVGTVGTVATKAAGDTTKAVAKVAEFAGDKFGKAGKSFVEGYASENTGMVRALAPLGATIAALYPSLKTLSGYYIKTTQSAQDYEKSMYGAKRANESQLKTIRELISSYTGLEGSMADVVKVSDPDVKKRRQELGTFESPLLTMSSIIKKSRDLSNSLADSNANLVVGYDKFGNAILNVAGNLRDYLKILENIKVKESAKVEIDVAAKFITDLTEIEGSEKWKYALKNLLKEAPAFGEVLAKGIKLSPAKAMDVVTERLNDMLALKKKFPMSTAFDKDIKKHQDNLKKVRSGFRTTYADFRRVLSDITTKGLSKDEIADLLSVEELRKGYELMIEVEPRFNLRETKGKVEWQDVLGAEVMRRAFPSFAATFDAASVLTKARLETAGAVKREGKAVSGDIAFFMEDAADKYGMAGNQAIVSLKETTDGVFDWFITYFNSKTLRIEERPFTEDLQNMVESIFPKNRIEEELSERIQSLNEFVAGAAAGLRGLSVKEFKKDFGLGERFFAEIPTTTILQGPKGYVPTAAGGAGAFGVSPFQKDWKETTEEFFFKPMREYRLKAEQLEKLRFEGLQGGEVTLARGLYEELTNLQNVLKNNQVVLQYRAVFVDFTKTLEEGTRALKENLAVEKSRLKLRKGIAGYQKGISEGLDAIDLGVQRFSDLTVKQRALMAGPGYGRAAVRFRELETRRGAREEQVYGIDRAVVALENIRQVSKGFGAALSSEDMKKYVEIIAKTDDAGAQSIAIETSKVVDNTADTVTRLDQILENMGDVSALEKQLENIGDMSPDKMVNTMEKVARVRDKKLEIGDKDSARAANKTLDILVNSLVEQVGIKKAMSMVDNNFTLFSKKFKPEEFAQKAFGGLDFKQFTAGMKENLPAQRSFFKRFLGIGEDLVGFDKEIKPLVKLQEKGNKEQWISSKEMIKMSAAMVVWSSFNKHQSSRVIKELESQRKEYKIGSDERKALDKAIEKERTSGIKEGRAGEDLWKLAQSFSFLTGTISMFAKELGMTEKQIKILGGASAGLYAGLKLASKITGEELPESAKKFEAGLKEAAITGKKGPLTTAGAELAKEAKTMFKKTGAISEKEYKKTVSDKDFKQFKDALDSAVKKQGDMSDKVGEFLSKARRPEVIDKRFLTKILATYLAATTAGYAAQRTEDETRLATLNAQAEKEAKMFVEIVEKYPEAAQKMIDARKEIVENMEKIKPVPTMEKPLVMDTEKERKKITGDLSKIREDIIDEHEKMTKELSDIAKKMVKLEIAEKFKMELEEMEKAIKDIDIATATQRVLESSLAESGFGEGAVGRKLFSQWSGNISDIIENRFEDMSDELKFPRAGGKLAGRYKPQPVDYGIRGISEMTPEEYLSYTEKRIAYRPSLGQFFGQEVSGPQRGEMGIVTLLKDVLSGRTLGISKVRTAEDLFKNLENIQKKRNITEAKFIEYMSRREELRGRKGKLSEAEREELDRLDDVIESLGDSLVTMTEDIARAKDALKTSLEEAADIIRQRMTAFDALKDLAEFDINRMFGTTAVLNRSLVGFAGGYELPLGKREMSLQQRIFTDATEGFNKSATSYAYKLNTLIPSMSQNMSEINSLRQEALERDDIDRYDELGRQLEKAKEAMDKMIESTRAMGEALYVANKFAEVMYKFKDAIEDIQVEEAVEDLPGFKGFRESMDKLFGGAHPLAPIQVSPEEERRAAQVGMELRDLRSTQFEKMEAEALYQLRRGGLEGVQYQEAMQRYLDIPEIQARAEEAYRQRQEITQLQRQAAPFEEMLKMLQRLAVSEIITPERKKEVISVRDALSDALDGFGNIMTQQENNIMTQQEKLSELEKNRALFTTGQYKEAKELIEKGAPEQYRGLTAWSQVGMMKEFGAKFAKLMQATPKADEVGGKNLGDVTSRQDTQIKILTQIAQKGFGFTPEDINIEAKPGMFDNIIKWLRKSVGSVWDTADSGKKAWGGRIFGEGGPREDKIPAMLSPGEYVIRAASAQKLGYGALEHMNQKGQIPEFAEGGKSKTFKIDPDFGTIAYDRYETDEEEKKEEKIAKKLMKKTKIGKTLSDRKKMLDELLQGKADGGITIGITERNLENLKKILGLTEKKSEKKFFKIDPKTGKAFSSLSLFMDSQMNSKYKSKTSLDEIIAEVGGLQRSSLSEIMDNLDKEIIKRLSGKKFADGGAVERLRAMGNMSEEDIRTELGGIEEALFSPTDIIGIAGGATKLTLGLGKGAIKYAAKKPKTYEELLNTVVKEKGGLKGIIEKFKTRRIWKKAEKRWAKQPTKSIEEEAMEGLSPEARYLLDLEDVEGAAKFKAALRGKEYDPYKSIKRVKKYDEPVTKSPSSDDILKVVENTELGITDRAYEMANLIFKKPKVKTAFEQAKEKFTEKIKAFGSLENMTDAQMDDYMEAATKNQFFRESEEALASLMDPSVQNSASKNIQKLIEKGGISDFTFAEGGMIYDFNMVDRDDRLFKGKGLKLPAGKTFEKVSGVMKRDVLAEAKRRVDKATMNKFKLAESKTIHMKPGTIEGFKYTGYQIPGKIPKASEDQLYGETIKTAAGAERKDLHILREMQRKLNFLGKNKEKAYGIVGSDKEEEFNTSLQSQLERTNSLIKQIQSGKILGTERVWDPEYKRYHFPRVEEYHQLQADFNSSPLTGITYAKIKQKGLEKYTKGFPKLGLLLSEQHSKILDLIKEDKFEEAKQVYKNALEQRKKFEDSLENDALKRRFRELSSGSGGLGPKKDVSKELQELRAYTILDRERMKAKATGKSSETTLNLLRKIFPELKTDQELQNVFKSRSSTYLNDRIKKANLSQSDLIMLEDKPTGELKHHGGEIRKTGHVFMQKGEVVYPKNFAEGGPVYGELAKEAVTDSLNNTVEVKVDVSALDSAIDRLESLELKIEDKKLEIVEDLPKLEIDVTNIDLTVDGDAAAAKIQAAVENISLDITSTGAVGAEELKNVSEQLEGRINSLNVSVEDLQNNLKMISSSEETIDINNLVDTKVSAYVSSMDRQINDVVSDISGLESKITQDRVRINVLTTELDRKIMYLQNLTSRGSS